MKMKELADGALLKAYIGFRDKRARRKAAFAADDESDKAKQEKIEVEFLERFNQRGIDNVSTHGVGTAYRAIRTSATVGDWDKLFDYVQDNDAWEMIERRVNKKTVMQFKEIHADLPPGVNWSETQVINFRRK